MMQARGLRAASIPTKGRLTYYQDKSLKLDLQYRSEDAWVECFETGPIKLPSIYYLGFSAETGELSDNFDVIDVQTHNLYLDPNDNSGKGGESYSGNKSSKQARKSSGWGWTFVKLILFLIVCGVAFVAYQTYSKVGPVAQGPKRTRFD